jgi:Pyruvate/2-oxoacid:ferredoxin oxidoreductase delta subunit
MNMPLRKIIEIDEERCDGCGLCVPACAEGAIQIIDGKARLVSDTYCDGLGACLGECPQDAIMMVEREAAEFNEESVKEHLAAQKKNAIKGKSTPLPEVSEFSACPGTASRMLHPTNPTSSTASTGQTGTQPSQLRNWPVQLHLVPIEAPYFNQADLLLAADCVPFAYPEFHQKALPGRTLIIACPKLDDVKTYFEKLTRIFAANNIRSIEIAFMEVPCCFGLVQLVRQALAESKKDIPLTLKKYGIKGDWLEDVRLPMERKITHERTHQ